VWCTLNDICLKITDGTHHSPTNLPKGDFMYVTAKNIKDNGVDMSNITYISAEIHQQIVARCNPELGDILFIKDGATTGVVTVNNLSESFSLLSSVALIKPSSIIYNKFMMYAMRSGFYYDETRKGMYGVAITRVTLSKIQQSIIPLPPLAEQHRIVAKLEQLLGHCDALEQRIRESRRLAEQLFATALREALAPPTGTASPEVAELELAEAVETPAHRAPRRGAQLALGSLLD